MRQKGKNTRSTKTKSIDETEITLDYFNNVLKSNTLDSSNNVIKSNEAHVLIRHSSKLHSDQTGKFPHTARSINQCLIVVYVVDANVMLAAPFKNKTIQQLIEIYLKLKKEIDKRGFTINIHVLDNKAPELHVDTIEASNSKYQLVPPNNHRCDYSKRAIRTCKENFMRTLIGIYVKFPMSMWNYPIEQTNIAVNLLCQSKVHPHLSVWSHCDGFIDYNDTPMVPSGCRVLIHEPVKT